MRSFTRWLRRYCVITIGHASNQYSAPRCFSSSLISTDKNVHCRSTVHMTVDGFVDSLALSQVAMTWTSIIGSIFLYGSLLVQQRGIDADSIWIFLRQNARRVTCWFQFDITTRQRMVWRKASVLNTFWFHRHWRLGKVRFLVNVLIQIVAVFTIF